MAETLTIYPLSNYTLGTKQPLYEEDPSVAARLERLKNYYEDYGMRRAVEGIMLVHEHGAPHVLMIQIANAFWKLPGDHLKPGEEETTGLIDRFHEWFEPSQCPEIRLDGKSHLEAGPDEKARLAGQDDADWQVGPLVSQWYRPHFEQFMYPYKPTHISKPKELKSFWVVQLPPKKVMAVPKNMKLLAVPLHELYDNSQKFGPQLASIPHWLSKFQFICA